MLNNHQAKSNGVSLRRLSALNPASGIGSSVFGMRLFVVPSYRILEERRYCLEVRPAGEIPPDVASQKHPEAGSDSIKSLAMG